MTKKLKNNYITDLSAADYHARPEISNSALTLFLSSPYRFWTRYLSPVKAEFEQTEAMEFGQKMHMFLLEPEKFYQHYLVKPKIRRVETSKQWQEYLAEANGREIIWDEDIDVLKKIKSAVEEHPIAKELIVDGFAEKSIIWQEPTTGINCKARPDFFTGQLVIDVKTTASVSARDFQKSIANYGYHRQAAFYIDAIKAVSNTKPEHFIFLCIEKNDYPVVAVYNLTNEAIAEGRKEYRFALESYRKHLEANHWPTNYEDIKEIGLPSWYTFTGEETYGISNY